LILLDFVKPFRNRPENRADLLAEKAPPAPGQSEELRSPIRPMLLID